MNEICINSERLYIITPKIQILEKRLEEETFCEQIDINNRYEKIHFPSDWPGEALVIYPFEIEREKKNPDILPYWSYIIIEKKGKVVVGGICCKAEPDEDNEIEIGYGISNSQQKKGYATEAVLSFISYFFNKTNVVSIKAECNVSNISSIKVLEKCGFNKTGRRFDEEDGNLIIWKKEKESL